MKTPAPHPVATGRLLLAFTTVANRADAERLAAEAIARNLAVCVQVDGPIASFYRWKGQSERAEEYRLCYKLRLPRRRARGTHSGHASLRHAGMGGHCGFTRGGKILVMGDHEL